MVAVAGEIRCLDVSVELATRVVGRTEGKIPCLPLAHVEQDTFPGDVSLLLSLNQPGTLADRRLDPVAISFPARISQH